MIEGAEGNNNWYISPVIVEIQEVKQETIPVEKITYRINGGEEELLPENKQIKLEEDGEYTIESFAYSKAGYKSKGATLTLKIEKSIQKLEMDLLADIKKLDIQVNAKAFSEITKYTYYLGKIGENGFVQYEIESPYNFIDFFEKEFHQSLTIVSYIQDIKHVFTHRKWHMHVYHFV